MRPHRVVEQALGCKHVLTLYQCRYVEDLSAFKGFTVLGVIAPEGSRGVLWMGFNVSLPDGREACGPPKYSAVTMKGILVVCPRRDLLGQGRVCFLPPVEGSLQKLRADVDHVAGAYVGT